jgi:hypothetical protein
VVRLPDELVEFALGDSLVGRGAADLTRLQPGQPAAFEVLRLGRPARCSGGGDAGHQRARAYFDHERVEAAALLHALREAELERDESKVPTSARRLAKVHLLARATGIPVFSSMSKDESGLPDSLFQRTRALERLLAHAKRRRFVVLACTPRRVTNRA